MPSAKPQGKYVERLPSPPRIVIPPPVPGLSLPIPQLAAGTTDLFGNIKLDRSFINPEWGDWQYNQRRKVHQILPFLYLGPSTGVKEPQFLQTTAITMVVAVRHRRPGQMAPKPAVIRLAQELRLHTLVIDVFDNQSLIAQFSNVNTAINSHFNDVKAQTGSIGKVVVCCESGNERSAAIVIAYIMEISDLDLIPAIQHTQNQRFCINTDDAMKQTLNAYCDVLKARKDVDHWSPPVNANVRQSILCNLPVSSEPAVQRRSSKRTLDDADLSEVEEDDIMADVSQDEPSNVRKFAPFLGT